MNANLVQGALFTMMVLPARDPQDPAFEAQLAEQIGRSPGFFLNAPVVLDLKGTLGFLDSGEFAELLDLLHRHKLMPVGVQNASPVQQRAALAAGLSCFAGSSALRRQVEKSRFGDGDADSDGSGTDQPGEGEILAPAAADTAPLEAATSSSGTETSRRTKIVTQPVRSGTQIYARGTDLIVASSVSSGAEIIADGYIHVYGSLRGRAIAGALGDKEARIFATRFEAELVSIAGRYLVRENISSDHIGQSVQILLQQDKVMILGY